MESSEEETLSPRHKDDWSNLFDTGSESESELNVDLDERVFETAESTQQQTRCCHSLKNALPENAVWVACEVPNIASLDCMINNSREYVNYSISQSQSSDEAVKINLIDYFIRMRHDALSSRIAKYLKVSYSGTDKKFCDMFPISSRRTPDFILQNGDRFLVVEVTAVSDPERAYKKKGHQGRGYESKYEKELEQIKALGIDVLYSVIVLDMSNSENNDHVNDLVKAIEYLNMSPDQDNMMDIDFLRREFINQTKIMYDHYAHYLGVLFGSPYSLKTYSDLLSVPIFGDPIKRYTGAYKRVGLSNFLFDKVVSITPRLIVMLNRLPTTSARDPTYLLQFEQLNSSFTFKRDQKGGKLSKWLDCIENNNYSWMCMNLVTTLNGTIVKSPKADFEFMSYDKSTHYQFEVKGSYLPDYSPDHVRSDVTLTAQLKDHTDRIKNLETFQLECKFEDEELEGRIVQSIEEMDEKNGNMHQFNGMLKSLSVKPLCHYKVGEESFIRGITRFNAEMERHNQKSEIPILPHVKPPFIYPIAQIQSSDYMDYRLKPSILGDMENYKIGDYTDKVLSIARSENFTFGSINVQVNEEYESAKLSLSNFHKEILNRLKEHHKENSGQYFPRMKELADAKELSAKLKALNDTLLKVASKNGIVNKNIGLVTMGRGSKSQSNIDFKREMLHFRVKDSKSHKKGVGNNFNDANIEMLMNALKSALLKPSDCTCQEKLYDDYVASDAKLLVQLKQDMIESNKEYHDYLRSTNLYHSCLFISRLCHTLMFHSQTSVNSSKVVVDNLGYDRVVLLVKGGKKIFSTKRSKLFRLIFPTFSSAAELYQSGSLTSNFKVVVINTRTYLVTPWMNMHETIIADGITFLYRGMGFAMLNRQPDLTNDENINRVYFNIILAMHNRRQTESMLHSLRYVFMNCMSEVSAIEEILPELAGFNYDYFQAWVRLMLAKNFLTFAKVLNQLHESAKPTAQKVIGIEASDLTHPFNGHIIRDYNTLALGIYSSYLMSKAPTTQLLEQVKNMKSIMSIHEEFVNKNKTVENCFVEMKDDFKNYYENLSENDFNFDPSYCHLLGKFMGDYLLNMERKSKLIQKWDSILERPWDEMSNTKGLRGKDDDFFGNKGYYVVYKEVLQNKENFDAIMNAIISDSPADEKEKTITKMNETYRRRISNFPLDDVVFHVVDKVQRGGSREIYVMDLETKVHQQVIEDYTKYLCRLIPNEMISIPSNKRLSTIHSRVFEGGKDNAKKYYWVLDCRKWAPKSLVEKFMVFLMGAKHALPETFVIHSMNFFCMMLGKKVYTRPKVVDVMTKSVTGTSFKSYFKYDSTKKAYYFDMPYSWVMGIFNYFSSLVHVANQMHASHIIRVTAQRSFGSENILHMVAHSDDSAGKIIVNNEYEMIRASFIYETLMHAANHLLSKKKCNQGKVYYEFLSILYIGGTLLSLLSKFTGIFNYHPTDKGYCVDITDAYSKSTELLLNGGTFEQSYIAMKIQAMLIFRFYFGRHIPKISYDLPPAMFGMPDAHPLMSLMCGSDADLFRIFKSCDPEQSKLIMTINEQLLPMESESMGLLKSFVCTPRVSLNNKLKGLKQAYQIPAEFLNSWTLKNVKFNNTQLNAAQFLMKLSDKSFISSLQDETLTRRLSRSYYFRSHITVPTAFGLMTPKDLKEIIFLTNRTIRGDVDDLKGFAKQVISQIDVNREMSTNIIAIEKVFNYLYCEVSRLYDYMDKIHYNHDAIVDNVKTCKPVYISVQKTLEECPVNYSPQSLSSWIKEPSYRNLLPDTRGYTTATVFVEKSLGEFGLNYDDLNPDQLCTVLQKIKKKSKTEYFCYSNLPWDLREINTYQDILNFMSHNTFPNKMIRGLGIQFSKTIGTPIENITADLKDDNLQITLTFLVLATALMSSREFNYELLEIDMKVPDFLGGGVMPLKNLIDIMVTFWKTQKRVLNYMQGIITTVTEMIKGNKTFPAEKIKDSYFHSFIKRQFLVDNVWLGQGKLFISLCTTKLVFIVSNIRVNSILVQTFEEHLDQSQVSYINLCLASAQLPKIQESMVQTEVVDWGLLGLCYDSFGNYYIGEVQGSLKHIPALFDLNLGTPLSSLEKGRIKSFRGSKLIWEATLDEKVHTHHLSTIPIETQNAALVLRGSIVDNVKNARLLSKYEGEATNIMVELCAKELDLERHISSEVMMKNYNMTDLYKVIKTCHTRSLCKVINPPLRSTNFPASDGGLLNALIQYSTIDNSFDFKWQRTISPEYMSLKSSQPEAFVSEISTTLIEKYNSLYTDIDKESLHRSLGRLANSGENLDTEIMNLLCTWGYTGVAGALGEMTGEKKIESFQKVRNYPKNATYSGLFENLYPDLVLCIMQAYKEGLMLDEFSTIGDFGCDITVNYKNINYYMMDIIHHTVLKCYNGFKTTESWVYDEQIEMVQSMLTCVILNKTTNSIFSNLLSKNIIARSLPTTAKSIDEWKIAIRTLRECYIQCNSRGHELDATIRRDLSADVQNPYVITREILAANGIKMKTMKLFHYGAISTHLYNTLSMNFVEEYKMKKLWFRVEVVSLSKLAEVTEVPYNMYSFPEKRFKESFLDTDEYDEIHMEYQGDEPDNAYIESVLTDYLENEGEDPFVEQSKKNLSIVLKGRLTKVLSVDLKIVPLFGGSMNYSNLSRLRMLGDDIIVLTDAIPLKLLLNKKIMSFRNRSTAWSGHSILNPRSLYYFVISRDIDSPQFWSRVLEADVINQNEIIRKTSGPFMTIRNQRGLLQNENEMFDKMALWNLIEKNMIAKEAEEEEERKAKQKQKGGAEMNLDDVQMEMNNQIEKFKAEGLDDNQIEKYRSFVKKEGNKSGWEALFDSLSNIEDENKSAINIKKVAKEVSVVINKPKTANQHEMIMQVPAIFGGGRSEGRGRKNNLFRERKIIAELESLCPGLIWKTLSGTLYLSQETYDMFKNQIEIYKMMIGNAKKHKKGKQFVVNLCMMILNDAVVIRNPKDDMETWRLLTSSTSKLMLLDEDKLESTDWDFQEEETGVGVLRYGVSGERELL